MSHARHRTLPRPCAPAVGFTLIELMFGLAMLAILMSIAVPSFRGFTSNNRVTSAQGDLASAFALARSEALKLGTPVSVCASADGATCTNDPTTWGSGWIVFRNPVVPGVVANADDTLQVWPGTTGILIAANNPYVQYQPNGLVLNPANTTTIQISWSGCSGLHTGQLQVFASGLLDIQTLNCP